MCMGVLPPCLCIYHVYANGRLKSPEEDIGFPKTGITHSCKPPCEYWESNMDSSSEQPVLSTA